MQQRDPVCGMMVDTTRAEAATTVGGERYVFCSTACRDRFEQNPSQFVAGSRTEGEELERHEHPHSHEPFTAPKFGSAGSGGAEFEPLPERHDEER